MEVSRDAIRAHLCVVLEVDPEQVSFKVDESSGPERVEILLQDSQIEWALRDDGSVVRQAARDLGIDIEIGAA